MEFPAKVTRIGQLLLTAMIVAVGATAWLESHSTISAALRAGQAFPIWLRLAPGKKVAAKCRDCADFVAIYQPNRRLLDLVGVSSLEVDLGPHFLAGLPLSPGQEIAPMFVDSAPNLSTDERPLAAREWLLKKTEGLGFWRELARYVASLRWSLSMSACDRFLMGVELHRTRPENLRAAWLPENEDQRRYFFANVFVPASETRSGPKALAVEVLNATRQAGIASTATDILRSNGADVVNVGNATSVRERTVIYDRTGRVENAETVRGMLGCADARVVTQVSPKKLFEVTVALAQDCATPQRKGTQWPFSRIMDRAMPSLTK